MQTSRMGAAKPVMMTIRLFIAALTAVVLAACSQTQQEVNVLQPEKPVPPVRNKGEGKPVRPVKPRTTPTPAPSVTVAAPRPFVPRKPGHRVSHVNVPGKYVAVTFDDGPNSVYTPQVLDIFKRHGARATFFVLGENAARNKSILARAAAEGHEIANHTYSHIKMTSKSRQVVAREIERTSEIIKSATGFYPTTMRPPYGATNTPLVEMMYNDYGMYSILWDIDTRDWQHPGVSTVVQRAVGKAQPGSIILLHDIHASTLSAVEEIVVGLQARGFKLVTVSQLIEMGRRAAGVTEPEVPAAAAAGTPPAVAAPAPEGGAAPEGESAAEGAAVPAAEPVPAGAGESVLGGSSGEVAPSPVEPAPEPVL